MGTPQLASASLRALLASPAVQVVAIVTQPDRPKGRELKLQASPVKELALQSALPVLQPERAREAAFIEELRKLQPELIAVAAYGQILPSSILELPRFGCLNVHTSLLPKYRGAAPIQWAILNGDRETGVTIMKMDAGLDTGAIVSQAKTPIEPADTAETLHDRLAQLGAQLLTQSVPDYVSGKLKPQAQPAEGVVYAPKIKKEDGHLRWSDSASNLYNRVRGLVPWPGAFTFMPANPKPLLLKIWQAEAVAGAGQPGQVLRADKTGITVACGDGALRILSLQREGGKRLNPQQFLAGIHLQAGTRFE